MARISRPRRLLRIHITTRASISTEQTTMPILSALSVIPANFSFQRPNSSGRDFAVVEHHKQELTADQADGQRRDHAAAGEGGLVMQRDKHDEQMRTPVSAPPKWPAPAMSTGLWEKLSATNQAVYPATEKMNPSRD